MKKSQSDSSIDSISEENWIITTPVGSPSISAKLSKTQKIKTEKKPQENYLYNENITTKNIIIFTAIGAAIASTLIAPPITMAIAAKATTGAVFASKSINFLITGGGAFYTGTFANKIIRKNNINNNNSYNKSI